VSTRSGAALTASPEYDGPYARYDILKEFTAALVVVTLLSVMLAVFLSSPDRRPITIRSWAQADPVDFVSTAVTELDGSSASAGYGPPYNSTPGAGQKIGPVSLQRLVGVHEPIDSSDAFVLGPLRTIATTQPAVAGAMSRYDGADPSQQGRWTKAYEDAAAKASYAAGRLQLPAGNYGPVAELMSAELGMARSGALDGYLLSTPQFYSTDYTKPLMFLADGGYMASVARTEHLQGSQWGMMNETGNYPGQAWLWLYTMWYQIPPFSHSGNADALIWGMMVLLTLLLILIPWIPGLRDIPRLVPVYRLIWREHYRRLAAQGAGSGR